MPQFSEERGKLVEIDFSSLPFVPKRVFYTTNVTVGSTRGEHAHKEGIQIIFCISGQVDVVLRSGDIEETVTCIDNGLGLVLRAEIWSCQKYIKSHSILMVICSHPFAENSYINEGKK